MKRRSFLKAIIGVIVAPLLFKDKILQGAEAEDVKSNELLNGEWVEYIPGLGRVKWCLQGIGGDYSPLCYTDLALTFYINDELWRHVYRIKGYPPTKEQVAQVKSKLIEWARKRKPSVFPGIDILL